MPELRREYGIRSATFYKWRAKYGGMDASMMSQMKAPSSGRLLRRRMADFAPPLTRGHGIKCDSLDITISHTET
jgi:hypothetical protein